MTSSLHERVAAAVELAGRATDGPWVLTDEAESGYLSSGFYYVMKPIPEGHDPNYNGKYERYIATVGASSLDQNKNNTALIAASHDHVALIKELYAALLASEEARVKAEVDAGRYRGLRYLAITVGDCSIFDKFKERCYDARAYDGEFDSDSDIAVLAMNSKSVWWRAKRDAAMQVTP